MITILQKYATQIMILRGKRENERFSDPFIIKAASTLRAASTPIDIDAWSDGSRLLDIFGPEYMVPVTKNETCLEMKLTDFLNTHEYELYLKDFHAVIESLTLERPTFLIYSVPPCFQDDWLNGFYDAMSVASNELQDYRFMYVGREGTNTRFHHDVMASHSWSLNLSGCKLWLFVHPDDANVKYYDVWGNLNISSFLSTEDVKILSSAYRCKDDNLEISKINLHGRISQLTHQLYFTVQLPGDSVFVPSGWHHEVINIGDGLITSVNQNWIEANGLKRMQKFLQTELSLIRERTSDRPLVSTYEHIFELHCQKLLQLQTGGFDLILFGKFLLFKADQVLQHVNRNEVLVKDEAVIEKGNPHVAPHLIVEVATLDKSIDSLIDALKILANDPFIANITFQDIAEVRKEETTIQLCRGLDYLSLIHAQLRVPKVRATFTRDDLIDSVQLLQSARLNFSCNR